MTHLFRHVCSWLQFALVGLLGIASSPELQAKPIAFQDGHTLMLEYGAGTMEEAQYFYAPRYWYSFGGGHVRLSDEDDSFQRNITYLRVNGLPKRWNLPNAQANVFVWGSLGSGIRNEDDRRFTTYNAGGQIDYETLHFYSALRSDWWHSSGFEHRIDTLQLGWAPYPHDYTELATWAVFQARHYTGGIMEDLEPALLLRLFKGNTWLEAGVTADGKFQAMLMFNY